MNSCIVCGKSSQHVYAIADVAVSMCDACLDGGSYFEHVLA